MRKGNVLMKELTRDEVLAHLTDGGGEGTSWSDEAAEMINRWLKRGDGAAIYQNQDFGSPAFGTRMFVSYGSLSATLETEIPPERMPDTPGLINWRYGLVGTYRGEAL